MYPASALFFQSIRNPPAIATRMEVWRGGVRIDGYGDDGIPIHGGEVDVDPGKQVRRVLSGVEIDSTDEMWDLLAPVGTELRSFRGFRYSNGASELIQTGRFVVPNLSETYGGNWSGQIGSASDRMILVQRARFTRPRAMPVGMRIADAIGMLISEVLGPASVLATSDAVTGPGLIYERDRGKAIAEMAASIGADVYCAPDGTPMVVDTPQLSATSVWTVDAGAEGVLYEAGRLRSYDDVYSGVVATPAQIDGAAPFEPVVVWDEDPASPTYRLGPF
ncbi:MAG: Peptidase match, partial [Frankiales bacterium]|nr:Peptidase match [Frankiales bacterium]